MNILVLYKEKEKGGLLTNTKALVEGLRSRGINTIVAGSDGPGAQCILKDLNVQIVNFFDSNPFQIYSELLHIVKKQNINIIHAQNRVPALYASVICFFNRKVKYVWANHQVPISSDFLHRITTRYGERAIAGSAEGYKMLTEKIRIPKDKVDTINLGIDIDKFAPLSSGEKKLEKQKHGIQEDEKVILLYGSLIESKGHIFFLEALEKVKNLPKVKIIFPGEGSTAYKNKIVSFAQKIGLADRIVFTGFVDGRELLSIADLMVLPSILEGYPISCIEAYCMGVPVIRTKTGGYEDTKRFCVGVDYGDTEALAAELSNFFSNDEKFNEKAQLALSSRSMFSMDNMIDQYIDIYKSILGDTN